MFRFRVALLAASLTGLALPAAAGVFTETYYIQVTFNHMGPTSANMFDASFTQLPAASWSSANLPTTSKLYAPDDLHFLRGADYEMVTRDAQGNVTVVSGMPTFNETNHHFLVWAMGLPAPYDIPLGAGSELTDFMLPAGYGVPLHGTEMGPVTWHWHNATGLDGVDKTGSGPASELDLFVRMVLTFEDDPATLPALPRWIANFGLCIPPGASGSTNTTGSAALSTTLSTRILTAIPHVHDHVGGVDLRLLPAAGGDVSIHAFAPDNSRSHPVEHDDCGGAGAPITWHVHGDGQGHLPYGGLQQHVFNPPGGFVLQPGDRLYASGSFDNPHAQAIDNMLVFIVYFAQA